MFVYLSDIRRQRKGITEVQRGIEKKTASVTFTIQTLLEASIHNPLSLSLPSQDLKPRLHDTTCCQTDCQTGCQTGLTTGCIV